MRNSAPVVAGSSQREITESPSTLDIAARSLLASQAISGTVAALVAERALDHAFIGLFQYAAIRVGVEHARQAMDQLVSEISGEDSVPLELGFGRRAALYSRLRDTLARYEQSVLGPRSSLWWKVGEAQAEDFAALRAGLTPLAAEVLELRFARRLSEDEIASVVGCDPDDVRGLIAHGLVTSRARFGAFPPSHDKSHEGVFLEAFALDPALVVPPKRELREPVLPTGVIVADRYEIEGLLGVGAFADVYRARDCEVTGHVVALKILRTRSADARSVRAALRELQLLTSVFHPSVVQLKDHGWHEDHLWFVMPLYRGETLAQRIGRAALSRAEARSIFEQLAEALATMHRAGIRHQDIKPENVFLASLDIDEPGTGYADEHHGSARILPVLLDLGVAAKDAELVLAGTPAYFAPEVAARFAQVPDPPPVGPKADVFSLALTLLRALEPRPSAQLPAGAVDAFVAYRAVYMPDPPETAALADLRPSFERWLSASPDKRPTAEEFRRELSVLTRPQERATRRAAMLRWLVPVSATVLALFFAVVTELSRQAEVSRTEAIRADERADRERARARSVSQSLSEQEARRAELEADVQRLEQQYQTSRMTREELASRLARTEGELTLLGDRDRAQVIRLRQQADELADTERQRARLAAAIAEAEPRIAELSDGLARERARGAEAEVGASRLAEQLRLAQAELSEQRAVAARLEERLAWMDALSSRTPRPQSAAPEDAPAP
jgi:serine/threonine protein kinase